MKILGKESHRKAMDLWLQHGECPVEPGEFVKVIPQDSRDSFALAWLYSIHPQRVRPMQAHSHDGASPLMVRLPLPKAKDLPRALFKIEDWLAEQPDDAKDKP